MRILILGGDGYLGWPTAMHLSSLGHDVMAVDNYLRRNLSQSINVEPLTCVPNLHERTRIWEEKTGHRITPEIGDILDWSFISRIFQQFVPDTIIHYAEQPSAPYSMLNRNAASLTIHNNVGATANVIFATHEFCPDAHIIKLGTMGEYGTPNIDIEEGWLEIKHKGRRDKFLYPRQASSLYHTTKIMDTDLLWFYVRTWDLRVTDLMQGPVYGIFTEESRIHSELAPFFSYDEIFGTVLNRFIVQAAVEHPLTVYGSGEQIRGYLNIQDTINCVRLSLENPAESSELRVFNQFTETFSVRELAGMVQEASHSLGLNVTINNIENPRKEQEEHYYNPSHTGLIDLGLKPNLLTQDTLIELLEYALSHRERIHKHKFFRNTKWN